MNIQVRNNPKGKSTNEKVKQVANYYLYKLLGADVKEVKVLTLRFKKLPRGIQGRVKAKSSDKAGHYLIELSKYLSWGGLYSTLAHECTHVKQLAKKELAFEIERKWRGSRIIRKRVRVWKGKRIYRSVYRSSPWEVEARKYQSILARDVEDRVKGAVVVDKPVERPKVEAKPLTREGILQAQILGLVKAKGVLPNSDLVPLVLSGNKDGQFKIRVHKAIFALKQEGQLVEFSDNGLIKVRVK